MKELTLDEREYNKKLNETFLYEVGYAYSKQLCAECDELLEKYKDLEIPESLDQWFEGFSAKIRRKENRKKFYHKSLKYSKNVAVFILAVGLIGGALIYSVEAVRIRVFNMALTVEDKFTEINIVEETKDPTIEDTFMGVGDYYLSYLPEGYSLEDSDGNDIAIFEYYSNGDSSIIFTANSTEGQLSVQIDTEDAVLKDITIHGNEGHYVTKKGHTSVFWIEGNTYLMISGEGDEAEIIKIAEGVIKAE